DEGFTRRQVGQLLDLVGREDAALDEAAFDVELEPRRAQPFVDQLRRRAQVVVPERDRDRSLQLRLESWHPRGLGGAAGQSVLDDAVLHVAGPQLAAKVLE